MKNTNKKTSISELGDKIVIYTDHDGNIELRADIEKDTIWATQEQIALLFDTSKQLISWHLSNIHGENELELKATVKEYLTVARNGKKYNFKYYNLDAIIAVGYRVNSKKATQFRIWATRVLREYLVNGYGINRSVVHKSPEKLEGLREAINLIESENLCGKLKGKITIKLTKDLESK